MTPAGWYQVPGSGEVRWHDDRGWTAHRIARGKPGGDWFAMEPPVMGYVLGAVFLVLGGVRLGLAFIDAQWWNAYLFLAVGLLWLGLGIGGSVVRAKPAPQAPRIAPACVQPVPGQVEGPGPAGGPPAGWYPVTPRLQRWWTGRRWAVYIHDGRRVRPTYGGPAAYHGLRITALVCCGIGVLAIVTGIVLQVVLSGGFVWSAVMSWVVGLGFILVGVIIYPVIGLRRGELLLPEGPPAGPQQPYSRTR